MAFQTVTFKAHNLIGNLREDYGVFTAGDFTGEVRTRLKWLSSVEVIKVGIGSQICQCFLNSQTTTEDQAADGGVFHFENTDAAAIHHFRAIGR